MFVVAFVLFLAMTFPFEMVARRLEAEAQRNNIELSIGSLALRGIGLRANQVTLSTPGQAGPPLTFARVDLKPDLLPLLLGRTAFGFSLDGYGGTAHGHARLSHDPKRPGLMSLQVEAQNLDLHAFPLPVPDAEIAGKLNLKLDLPVLQPLELASGQGTLSIKGASLVRAVARLEGGMTMTLPKASLGNVEASFTLEKGAAKIEKLIAKGGDLDAEVDGTIALRPALALSQADLHVKLRPGEKWLDLNPTLRAGLGFLGPRAGDGSYSVSLSGPLTRLQPRPGR